MTSNHAPRGHGQWHRGNHRPNAVEGRSRWIKQGILIGVVREVADQLIHFVADHM
jgi:hypothetical protein